jgi:RHS repeat-associated protein
MINDSYLAQTDYTYNTGTNLLASTFDGTQRDFTYDASGNMITDGAKPGTFRYDIYNQLDSIYKSTQMLPDSVIAFGYSPVGERVFKKMYWHYKDSCEGGAQQEGLIILGFEPPPPPPRDTLCVFADTSMTRYIRSQGKVLMEINETYAQQFKYIYAGDQRIAMRDGNGNLYYYLNDYLGSARVVVDSAGTVGDKYMYYAFGDNKGSLVSTNQPRRYTGKPFDDDAGIDLYYYGARYYDPTIGRFISVDPSANQYPSWGPYVYAADNPLKYIDPDGRVLVLTGAETDVTQTVQVANEGMGPAGKASVDGNGTVTVTANSDIVGPASPEQQAMFNTMSAAADPNTATTTIGVTNGSNSVMVGSYALQQIDIADIQKFGDGPNATATGALGHEVAEQMAKQVSGVSNYANHHQAGIAAENAINGSVRGARRPTGGLNRRGTGRLDIPFTRGSVTNIVTINVLNMNITSVVQ